MEWFSATLFPLSHVKFYFLLALRLSSVCFSMQFAALQLWAQHLTCSWFQSYISRHIKRAKHVNKSWVSWLIHLTPSHDPIRLVVSFFNPNTNLHRQPPVHMNFSTQLHWRQTRAIGCGCFVLLNGDGDVRENVRGSSVAWILDSERARPPTGAWWLATSTRRSIFILPDQSSLCVWPAECGCVVVDPEMHMWAWSPCDHRIHKSCNLSSQSYQSSSSLVLQERPVASEVLSSTLCRSKFSRI